MTADQQTVWVAVYAATVQALGAVTQSMIAQRDGMDTWERIRRRAAWEAEAAVQAFNKADNHGPRA